MNNPSQQARFTQAVERELAAGTRREPLWAEALQAAGGDETAARERYLQRRVEIMLADERAQEEALQARQRQRRSYDGRAMTTAGKNALFGLGFLAALALALYFRFRR